MMGQGLGDMLSGGSSGGGGGIGNIQSMLSGLYRIEIMSSVP